MLTLAAMYSKGDEVARNAAKALRYFEAAAQSGHTNAWYLAALILLTEDNDDVMGVRNVSKAVEYLNIAASATPPLHAAQTRLGLLYLHGKEGVTKDEKRAITLLTSAAAGGDAEAAYQISMLLEGKGENERAVRMLQSAADKGHAAAQYNLGVRYDQGLGVPQDYFIAKKYFEKSAAQGSAFAIHNLGTYLSEGKGGVRDLTLSFQHFTTAASMGPLSLALFLSISHFFFLLSHSLCRTHSISRSIRLAIFSRTVPLPWHWHCGEHREGNRILPSGGLAGLDQCTRHPGGNLEHW